MGDAKEKEHQQNLEKSKESGRNETIELFKKVRKELEDCKKDNDELRRLMGAENDKRVKEAQAIQDKLEREKQELRDYIEKDKESLSEKMSKDKENLAKALSNQLEEQNKNKNNLEDRLKRNEDEKNEILQLYEKMRDENDARKRENSQLKDLVAKEKEFLFNDYSRGTSQVKEQAQRDKDELERKLEDQRLEAKQKEDRVRERLGKDGERLERLGEIVSVLRQSVELPGHYFCAVREEPYCTGGEEYLTFHHCSSNMGGGMDPKSGVYTASVPGCYLFSLTVCAQDMKKVLIALRKNGEEVATIYDQNHNDNHRNSMAGQNILLELLPQDKVQVYVYTFTGLQDKPANHLTQFLGFLLRPSPPVLPTLEAER